MSRTSIELNPLAHPTAVHARPSQGYPPSIVPSFAPSVAPSVHTIQTFESNDGLSSGLGEPAEVTSKGRTLVIILSTTLVTGIGSMLNGLVTVTLPQLAVDLGIQDGLLLW